jgi:hypothetical protein
LTSLSPGGLPVSRTLTLLIILAAYLAGLSLAAAWLAPTNQAVFTAFSNLSSAAVGGVLAYVQQQRKGNE